MKQEEKDLLIRDLCARLPYGVKVEYKNEIFDIEHVSPMYEEVKLDTYETWTVGVSDIKPYLFPLSSMTEEQMFDFATVQAENCKGSYPTLLECSAIIDWGYKHHFDVNNLIEKGLAIDATGLNIY